MADEQELRGNAVTATARSVLERISDLPSDEVMVYTTLTDVMGDGCEDCMGRFTLCKKDLQWIAYITTRLEGLGVDTATVPWEFEKATTVNVDMERLGIGGLDLGLNGVYIQLQSVIGESDEPLHSPTINLVDLLKGMEQAVASGSKEFFAAPNGQQWGDSAEHDEWLSMAMNDFQSVESAAERPGND